MTWILLLIGFCGMCCPSCNSDPGELGPNHIDSLEVHFNMQWALNWDSVEILVYRLDSPGVLQMISRKQTFNRRFKIETSEFDRDDLYEVIRVSQQYARVSLQTVFRREDPLHLHKMTFSRQDPDGNSFIEVLADRFIYRFIYSSYLNGDGYEKLSKNSLFEDQLVYTLRSLNFEEGLEFNCMVYPSIQNAELPVAVNAVFKVSKAPDSFWNVRVDFPERWSRYTFAAAYPNELLEVVHSDTRGLTLLVSGN